MEKTILDAFFSDNIEANENCCTLCGKAVPNHISICWNCGQVLSKQLLRLMKLKKSNNN